LKVYTVTELKPTDIPIEEVLVDGKFDIYPEVQEKNYFNIIYRKSSLSIYAGRYIGLIPINNRIAIRVEPKVPFKNIIHIISKSKSKIESMYFFERYYTKETYYAPNIFEFIVRTFLHELHILENQGIYRKYLPHTENASRLKGKILFNETMKYNLARNIKQKACYSYHFLDRDIPENRVIKYALWGLLLHYQAALGKPDNLLRDLYYAYRMFEHVSLDKTRNFIPQVNDLVYNKKIPTIRNYYYNILRLCFFILESSSITIERDEREIKLPSFVVNMDKVFEKYLLYTLKEKIDTKATGIQVLDGNTREGQKSLFVDRSEPKASPDIVLKYEEIIFSIIDAKYKERPKRADYNQVITYCASYGTNEAILVCPKTDVDKKGEHYTGEIDGRIILEYYFDLERANIEAEENDFCNYIRQKVESFKRKAAA